MTKEMTKETTDIVFLTLPRLELRSPITAPAILKASVENNGYSAFCFDLNIDLWLSIDPAVHGHTWFDTDLTFRYRDKFEVFWAEVIKPREEYWCEIIRAKNPTWVGMTIFSQRSEWMARSMCQLLRREFPNIKIVVGGPLADEIGGPIFEQGLADAYVIGEGENAILDVLAGNLSGPGINGTPPEQIEDLNTLPIPDYSDFDFLNYPSKWIDPSVRYETNHGSDSVYITGSRGCVRKCSFCDIGKIWPKFRYRSGQNIAEEMRIQHTAMGARRFLFTDSLINGSVKQLTELCETLIDYKNRGLMLGVKWQGQFIARSEKQMPEHLYALMKESGCFFVSIGVESGSQKVREDMNKMVDDASLDFTYRMCAKYSIEMSWLLLVGYPTEDATEFQKTLDMLDRYKWINDAKLIKAVSLGPTLDLMPGSPLFVDREKMGITLDEYGHWVYQDNTREVRIRRWLELKQQCVKLGYTVIEKANDHLLNELNTYYTPTKIKKMIPIYQTLGSMGPSL